MIHLSPIQIDRLVTNMHNEDQSMTRNLALTDPSLVNFADEHGEPFDQASVDALHRHAQGCAFRCYSCERDLPIHAWTRDSSGLDLCQECMTEAEWENTHSDYGHELTPDPDCPICKAEAAAPAA